MLKPEGLMYLRVKYLCEVQYSTRSSQLAIYLMIYCVLYCDVFRHLSKSLSRIYIYIYIHNNCRRIAYKEHIIFVVVVLCVNILSAYVFLYPMMDFGESRNFSQYKVQQSSTKCSSDSMLLFLTEV